MTATNDELIGWCNDWWKRIRDGEATMERRSDAERLVIIADRLTGAAKLAEALEAMLRDYELCDPGGPVKDFDIRGIWKANVARAKKALRQYRKTEQAEGHQG